MGVRIVPETFNRQDWPRLVAANAADAQRRLAALETGGVSRAKGKFLYG